MMGFLASILDSIVNIMAVRTALANIWVVF